MKKYYLYIYINQTKYYVVGLAKVSDFVLMRFSTDRNIAEIYNEGDPLVNSFATEEVKPVYKVRNKVTDKLVCRNFTDELVVETISK